MRSTVLLLLIPELTLAAPRVRKHFVGLTDGSYGKTTDSKRNGIYRSGDLIYSKKHVEHFFGNKTRGIGSMFERAPKKLWNQNIKDGRMEIAYKILDQTFKHPGDLQELKKILENVKKDFIQKTALRLVPREERRYHDYFIQFHGGGDCHSPLGRESKEQTIHIGKECVHQMLVQHEIMHSLGWHHEHQRPDRDKYIDIFRDRIAPWALHDFKIPKESRTHGTQYETNSIMQYPRESFGRRDPDHHVVTMRERSDLRNQQLKSFTEYSSKYNTDRGFTDTDAYEINTVYTLKAYCEAFGKKWYWLDESTGTPFKSGAGSKTPENTCVERTSLKNETRKLAPIIKAGKRRIASRLMKFTHKMLTFIN